ncbi:MAG: c-type cytochrome [bacterium]
MQRGSRHIYPGRGSGSWSPGAWCLPALLTLSGQATGCRDKPKFSGPQVLGGRKVSAKILNRGHKYYTQFCEVCHGVKGNGKGPAAPGTLPPPRDFTKGYFKYVSVPGRRLPVDRDLLRSMNGGLQGTRMPAWGALTHHRKSDIVQYLKTFSKRWRTEKPGQPIVVVPDPWKDKPEALAQARGALVYHGLAQCWECHPTYQDRSALEKSLADIRAELGAAAPKPVKLRSRAWRAAIVPTEYGSLQPADFLGQRLHGGSTLQDLYRAVAAGIGGTPMPTWFEKLKPTDLWAVVHYVKSLLRLQKTPAAEALRKRVRGT